MRSKVSRQASGVRKKGAGAIVTRAFMFSILCFMSSGCQAEEPSRVCVKDVCYAVETVRTPEARERGLMFRDELKAGQGMLFVFEGSGDHPFWMKGMKFPIDIIWINEEKKIVHIASSVLPCQAEPCAVYYPHAQASYVLEVPAGDSVRYGFSSGQKAVSIDEKF